jgi:hypothetical protein
MGRAARRRSIRLRVRPIGVGALLVVLAWGVSAAYAEAPTVTFEGGPLAPALCPAAPDQPNLDIDEGTWVNVVNRTGAKATLEIDGSPSQTIPKNGGLSVGLPAGRHDLRLIPQCVAHGMLLPVEINVAVVQLDPTTAPSTSPAAPPAGPPPSGGPGGSGGPPDDGGGGDGGVTGPAGGVGDQPVGPDGEPADGASDQDGGAPDWPAAGDAGIVVVPYAVPETEDPRGARLLAVIATICVSGVTVAIIRAIIAQRTTRMISL